MNYVYTDTALGWLSAGVGIIREKYTYYENNPSKNIKIIGIPIIKFVPVKSVFISLVMFLPGIFEEHNVAKLEAERLQEENTSSQLGR